MLFRIMLQAELPAGPSALELSSRDRVRLAVLDQRDRIPQHRDAGIRLDAAFGEMAAERARPRDAVKRADEMPRDRMQAGAVREFTLDVRRHRYEHVVHSRMPRCFAEQL